MTQRRRTSYGLDHARTHVEHALVKATLANFTDGAVLLTNDKVVAPVWVPRFALDPSSRALLHRSTRGQEVELQVQLHIALQKGLV